MLCLFEWSPEKSNVSVKLGMRGGRTGHEPYHRHVDEASQQRVVDIVGCRLGPGVHAARGEDVRAKRDRDVHVWAVDRWLRGHRVRDEVLGRAEVPDVKKAWLLNALPGWESQRGYAVVAIPS